MRTEPTQFAIVDSWFPDKEPRGFRNSEICAYLDRFATVASYTMYPMKPGPEAWFAHGYGKTAEQYADDRAAFLRRYPHYASRIHHLEPEGDYRFRLAYSFFLAETYTLLPFYERHRIPFVFKLYPGGAFGLDNPGSDAMLRRVVDSDCFRRVFVTQRITHEYLLDHKLCDPARIVRVMPRFVQFRPDEVLPRRRFAVDKPTLDICFVANKYSERGVDKGYDLFVDTARILARRSTSFRFHVVGAFAPSDIEVDDLGDRLTFHGSRTPDYLREFFAGMDVMISPNRPGALYPGNFDGFPLGGDARCCGVLTMNSDVLNMNEHYRDGVDICIIDLDAAGIADRVMHLHDAPEELHAIAQAGQAREWTLTNVDAHFAQMRELLADLVDLRPPRRGLGVRFRR